jgi:lipopolysaccharide transport system permease protein
MLQSIRVLARSRRLISFIVQGARKTEVAGTSLGWLWRMVDPLVTVFIYFFVIVIIFGSTSDTAYATFIRLVVGVTHYLMLQKIVLSCTRAILNHESLLLQVKLEPMILVGAAYWKAVLDALPAWVLGLVLYVAYGPALGWSLALYPVCLAAILVLGWGLGLLVATLCVHLRDIHNIASFAFRLGFYLAPVLYPLNYVPERYRELCQLNPLTGLIASLQWSAGVGVAPDWWAVGVSGGFILAGLITAHLAYERLKVSFTKVF